MPVLRLAETVGGVADLSNQLAAATGVLRRRVGRHRLIVSCRTNPRGDATPELKDAVTNIRLMGVAGPGGAMNVVVELRARSSAPYRGL